MDKGLKFIGHVSFVGGIFISAFLSVGSLFNPSLNKNFFMLMILVVLGILIGILNITKKEQIGFLIASVALVNALFINVNTAYGNNMLNLFNILVPKLGDVIFNFVFNIVLLVVPASIIIGIRSVFKFAKEK